MKILAGAEFSNSPVIIAEDDAGVNELIQRKLKKIHIESIGVTSGGKAMDLLKKFPDALLILDYSLPDYSAKEILEELKKNNITPTFIIITGQGDEKLAVEMMKLGARDYLVKDRNFLELVPTVVKQVLSDLTTKELLIKTTGALERTEHQFRLLTDSIREIVLLCHTNLKLEFVSLSLQRLLGWEVETAISKNMLDFISDEDKELVNQQIQKTLKGKGDTSFECRLVSKDDDYVWFEIVCHLLEEYEKGKNMLLCTARDISSKREAEDEVLKLTRAIDQNPALIVITNTKGEIEYVNNKFTEVTGYTKDEVIGKNPRLLKSGETKDEEYSHMWKTIAEGGSWTGEFHNKKKNGEFYWARSSISAIRNKSGAITHYIAVNEDVTQQKELEADLIAAKEKAESGNRFRSNLLANMSHEFRTPMNGILGCAQILASKVDDPNMSRMVEIIRDSGKRLMVTLNNILELSELQSQSQSHSVLNQYSVISLDNIIHRLKQEFTKITQKYNLSFSVNYLDEDIKIRGEAEMVLKALRHIIDNAVKYTNEGGIEVTVKRTTINGKMLAEVAIADTGIGILKENQEVIFKEFRQVSEGRSRKYEGSGLGLSLVKKIVEIMRGYITIESEINKGSVFTVRLPLADEDEGKEKLTLEKIQTKEVTLEEGSHKDIKDNKLPLILLVEDDSEMEFITENFLDGICVLDYAKDGITAIKLAEENKYSAVLMDINLGAGMDGMQATRLIRQIEGYSYTPIIALTGYTLQSDRQKLLSEGCTHYLAKPYSQNQLVALLKEIL